LEAVAEGRTFTDAAVLIGHPRSTLYALRQRDVEFAAALEQALEAGTDVLEREAQRRAVEGWDEEVFGKGPDGHVVQVGTVRKYSDHLLARLLAGRRPMYKDNPRVQVSTQVAVQPLVDRSKPASEVWKVLEECGVDPEGMLGDAARAALRGDSYAAKELEMWAGMRRAAVEDGVIEGELVAEVDEQ
jgi:hypothetical protein